MADSSLVTERDAPTVEMIREQLQKIIDSNIMRATGKLSRFLSFVVEETLKGRQFEIKEYTIGVHVFRRPATFVPQTDAIVRINAGRLRRMLRRYYDEPGNVDLVRIEIPKGTYIPSFSRHTLDGPEDQKTRANYGLTLAILPFSNAGSFPSHFEGKSFSEDLFRAICSTNEFNITSYQHSSRFADDSNIPALARILNAQYLLVGHISSQDQRIHLHAQLIFAHDVTVAWAKSFESDLSRGSPGEIRNQFLNHLHSMVGGFGGILMNHLVQLTPTHRDATLGRYVPIFWLYLYKKVYTRDILLAAHHAVSNAIKSNPFYSTPWAVLAHIQTDTGYLNVYTPDDIFANGAELAQKSLTFNPKDQHGHVALAYTYLAAGKKTECLQSIGNTLDAGDLSVGLRSFVFSYLTLLGEYSQASIYLEKLSNDELFYSWTYCLARTVYAIQEKDYEGAMISARKISDNGTNLGALMRIAIAGIIGMTGDVKASAEEIRYHSATERAREMFARFILDDELVANLMSGLEVALNSKKI